MPFRPCGRGALKRSVPQLELRGGEAGGTGLSAQQLGLGSLPGGGGSPAWRGRAGLGGGGGCVVRGTQVGTRQGRSALGHLG